MADVVSFPCVRPRADVVDEVAALPYDVYNLAEAREEIARHPHSFLRIDMAETMLPDTIESNDPAIYEKARELLEDDIADGLYIEDLAPHYYLYRLCAPDGRSQTGVVGCASIDDYQNGIIKKHENTKPDKEIDRIRHVDTCNAQTGPIFLAFRSDGRIEAVMERAADLLPLYDFTADDGVRHTVWRVDDAADEAIIRESFESTDSLYLADGHHRTASAVKAGLLRREQAQAAAGVQSWGEAPELPSDHFLSVNFPSSQLEILDYNRVVSGLNGLSKEEYLERVREHFDIAGSQAEPFKPQHKGSIGMFVDGQWYALEVKDELKSDDPVAGLDVSILQNYLLDPILGIKDPRTDKRIDFVGGIRGLAELERRVATDMTVGFGMYPTSIEELFAVADAGLLMPPKSTWFEPKPRSGIFIHRI